MYRGTMCQATWAATLPTMTYTIQKYMTMKRKFLRLLNVLALMTLKLEKEFGANAETCTVQLNLIPSLHANSQKSLKVNSNRNRTILFRSAKMKLEHDEQIRIMKKNSSQMVGILNKQRESNNLN